MKSSCKPEASSHRLCFFTIIELLVVLAVVMLLMSLLLPSLQKAKERARQTYCAGNLRQMGNGMMFYVNDNNGWLPNYRWRCITSYFPPISTVTYSNETFHCPSHVSPGPTVAYYYFSYAINSNIGYCGGINDHHGKIDRVKVPSMSVLLGENGEYNVPAAYDVKKHTVAIRHNAGANYLFVDTHVKWFKYGQDSEISWMGFQ
jgi:prepilin-type processing-associated H-X9-DG protein